MDFDNRTALVTGAGSGIGRSAAVALARKGATVAVVGHSADSAQDTVDEIGRAGGTAHPYVAELSDPQAVQQLYDEVSQRTGTLDVVVANAGINGVWAPIDELTPEGGATPSRSTSRARSSRSSTRCRCSGPPAAAR